MSHLLRTPNRRRHGLTLVEMMVSVVLTLMVVFAVVRVFESLGDSVTDGRATIEMSSNLRTAAQLLRDDLDGLTTTSLPPRAPERAEGYLEIIDGPGTASQYPTLPAGGGLPYLARTALNGGVDADLDSYLDNAGMDSSVGDVDDILALTSYRPNKPFLGTVCHPLIQDPLLGRVVRTPEAPTAIIESDTAEVIWWLQVEKTPNGVGLETLTNGTYLGFPGRQIALATGTVDAAGNSLNPEQQLASVFRYPNPQQTPVRSLHRRQLLIRPDLDLSGITLVGEAQVSEFLSNNDISVRVVRDVAAGANRYKVIANSLADLAERENRAYRTTWQLTNRTDLKRTRLSTPRLGGILLHPQSMLMRQGMMKDMVVQFPLGAYNGFSGTDPHSVIMLRKGKDIVLNDVLDFNLKVWDPLVRLRAKEGTLMLPDDPGYLLNDAVPVADTNGSPLVGGYVDLGYGFRPKVPSPLSVPSQFRSGPHSLSQLIIPNASEADLLVSGMGVATYCTWSSSYEYDGIDQNGNGVIDEGHDGLDNNNARGTDDVTEMETSPPYPYPLRGVQVSLRTIDFATRQIRQTSVTKDLLPE